MSPKQTVYVPKLFLSTYNYLERAVNDDKDKPGWVTSYNFVTLLNLPREMESLGPLVDLWEGKFQGEGIIPCIKAVLGNGLRGKWQFNLLTELLQQKSLKAIMRTYRSEEEEEADWMKSARDQSLHYHSYSSEIAVREGYYSKKALSAVMMTDGCIGCVVGRGSILRMIQDEDSATRYENEMQYCGWTLMEDMEQGFSSNEIVASLLFLPVLVPPKLTGMYTVINSRWQEYREGTFQLPAHIRSKTDLVHL